MAKWLLLPSTKLAKLKFGIEWRAEEFTRASRRHAAAEALRRQLFHGGRLARADLDRDRQSAVGEQETLDAIEQVAAHPVDDEAIGRQQSQAGAGLDRLQGFYPGVELLLRQFVLEGADTT